MYIYSIYIYISQLYGCYFMLFPHLYSLIALSAPDVFFRYRIPFSHSFTFIKHRSERRLINYLRSLPESLVQEYMDEVGG